MNRKYEFTGETKRLNGVTLRRIRAVADIPDQGVFAGDLGGWLESEGNLSHEGAAWVSGDALVSDYAEISALSEVSGGARVFGRAQVSGGALVSGDARVFGREDEPAALALAKTDERQREKVDQERLSRADDLHQYLILKGEA